MPRNSAMTMEGFRSDFLTEEEDQISIAGFRPPFMAAVLKEHIDCKEVYDTFHGCDNLKALYLSPNGLDQSIDDQKEIFYQSDIKFMEDFMDTRKVFTENRNVQFWFFQKKDTLWWMPSEYNEETVKKYKESIFRTAEYIASYSKVGVGTYLEMGANSWIIFSKWREISDPDSQAAARAMYHYALDNGAPADFKNMWEEDILRAVQRENPFWYKTHPVPNLSEDREVDVLEWCKAVEWWRRWVK